MRQLLLTIFFCLFIIPIFGQDYYPPIENYSTNNYGKDRNPENYAIVQDNRGVMYFGNANGVIEYDGKNWNFIEVALSVFVYSLAIDEQGIIYVGSNAEFGYLKADETGLLKFHSLKNKLPKINQLFSEVRFTYVIGKEVFYMTEKALFVYNSETEKLKVVNTKRSFHTCYVANETLYIRERQTGVLKWDGTQLKFVEGTSRFKNTTCFGVFSTDDTKVDQLLFVTNNDGVYRLDNGVLTEIELTGETLKGLKIFGAIRLSDGNIALRTFDQGVHIISTEGKPVYSIDRSTGLRSADIRAMFEDRDQNLWLGLGNGIAKVNYYSPLSFYNEKSGIEGNVQTFIRYQDLLYVGSSFGIYVQDTARESLNEFRQIPTIRDQVWDFEIVNEVLYIATTDGVFRKDGIGKIVRINYINTNKMYWHNNKIIAGGANGVYVYSEKFNLDWKDEIPLNTVIGIEKDPLRNEYWIGTAGSGAIKVAINGDEINTTHYGEGDGFSVHSGLVAKPIIFEDELIFGSYGLCNFYHEDSFSVSLLNDGFSEEDLEDPNLLRGWFDPIPLYDSLFEEEILLIEEDKDRTWYVAEHKLGFYSMDNKKFINKPFWGINYGRINNLYLEESGQLWIGCADGLIRYSKNERKDYKSVFSTLIRRIIVDKDTVFNGTYPEGKQVIIPEIDFSENNLTFFFASPYFEDEHKPKFSFILEGYDSKWSNWSNKNEKGYTNLNAGTYTFKVRSQNIYDQISDTAEYTFVILPPWYQTIWAYLGYVILFLVLIYTASRISSMRLKARNEQLESIVDERTKEISQKNEVLEIQNVEISEQKREIEDSINYAKRIQDAILPLEDEMKKWLPNSFVFYRPKDIVSGDFYWFAENKGKLIVVCADCTGHGVPGAFMSMIGSDRLNIIVNERGVTEPGKILSELNRAIKKSLKQKSGEDSTKDGMDAAICTIDLKSKTLTYAGAHRPLWIIQNSELSEIKATKHAVAGFTPDNQVFEEHILEISEGMKFYMSTDGYADQFGGEKGKKYMVRKMKKMIIGISENSYQSQHVLLENEILGWMNNYQDEHSQVDDICVMGFEL